MIQERIYIRLKGQMLLVSTREIAEAEFLSKVAALGAMPESGDALDCVRHSPIEADDTAGKVVFSWV